MPRRTSSVIKALPESSAGSNGEAYTAAGKPLDLNDVNAAALDIDDEYHHFDHGAMHRDAGGISGMREGIPSAYFFDMSPHKRPFIYPLNRSSQASTTSSAQHSSSTASTGPAFLRSYHPKHIAPRKWEHADRVRLRTIVDEQMNRSKQSKKRASTATSSSSSSSRGTSEPGGKHANIDWNLVSRGMGSGHSPMECLMQYRNVEEPTLRRLAAAGLDASSLRYPGARRGSGSSISSSKAEAALRHIDKVSEWTAEEVQKLRDHVRRYGDCDWVRCSDVALGGLRSPLECIQYYQQNVNNALIRNDDWTAAEDASLRLATRIYDFNWSLISDAINGRTSAQCRYRWETLCAEDECANAPISKNGDHSRDGELGGGGEAKVLSGRWGADEERRLVLAAIALRAPLAVAASVQEAPSVEASTSPTATASIHGARAKRARLEERDASSSRLASDAERGERDSERQEASVLASTSPNYTKHGFLGWDAVAQFVPHRNAIKCREKWVNVLDPTVIRDDFTLEEDRLLIELASARLGGAIVDRSDISNSSSRSSSALSAAVGDVEGSDRRSMASGKHKVWSEIAQHFPGRTDNYVFRRWKRLCPKETVLDYLSVQHVKRQFEPSGNR